MEEVESHVRLSKMVYSDGDLKWGFEVGMDYPSSVNRKEARSASCPEK